MKIGIIGAGQLGRMLALAGYPLGQQFCCYDRTADTPGGQVAPIVTGEFDDLQALQRLAERVDVVTFDWENVPVASLRHIAKTVPVYPPVRILEVAQDRLLEKTLFRDLGIPTNAFAPVDLRLDLEAAITRIGLPGVLKTRRLGYDGKGQYVLKTRRDVDKAWAALGGQALIYEAFVDFEREVSLIAVRGRKGELAFYPLSENVHERGILSCTRAPYRQVSLQRQAERHLKAVMQKFQHVGVLTIEFFVADGRLLANEMAPRVHNSGHWTIEGAVTSQFENHVRAIAGLPLGETRTTGHSLMVNYVGRMPKTAAALGIPGLHLHDYGKAPRPGRKLGHGTLVAATPAARDRALAALLRRRGPLR
jgi:5-(carboxyamino)imidazole ribonucleotide synthase